MPSPMTTPLTYEPFSNPPGARPVIQKNAPFDPASGTLNLKQSPEVVSLLVESQQLKHKLDSSIVNCGIVTSRLCEYILLLRDMEARYLRAEAKCLELERNKRTELDVLNREIVDLRQTCERSEADISVLRKELVQDLQNAEIRPQLTKNVENPVADLEYKPADRPPEDIMKGRFHVLAQLPVPKDALVDVLKPIGIPERFTIHEFLLGSASGSLKDALSGYCAFTEGTMMWCPQREEHGFYLTPLYKCDTGPRSNVIHRWLKVDVKARMPRPTECFYRKGDEWYYTGTYQSFRLEDLTSKEYDNLSESTRDVLIKQTLAGRKNITPQVIFETSQLYAAGALKVAVVGIQCIGFNRMLYSVILQQAQRFRNKFDANDDTSKAVEGGTL